MHTIGDVIFSLVVQLEEGLDTLSSFMHTIGDVIFSLVV